MRAQKAEGKTMPCYTVQTLSVEFQLKHADMLMKAAKTLGINARLVGNYLTLDYDIQIDLKRGQASYRERNKQKATETLNLLKKQYSIEAISVAATRSGWNKQQLARLNAKRKVNRMTITRR
jgi:hypothetical protein